MKSEQEYYNDLTQIRTMMERSTKFLSLAGWSGIMVGVLGLAAAALAIWKTGESGSAAQLSANLSSPGVQMLIGGALLTLVIAVTIVAWFSWKKSARLGQPVWNAAARRLVVNMAIPLATGGILAFILALQGIAGLIPAVTLLFYGAAMLNAGNFTFGEVRYLGMIEMALGLLAAWITTYSLVIWAFGFGVMHIVYGIYLHQRYEK